MENNIDYYKKYKKYKKLYKTGYLKGGQVSLTVNLIRPDGKSISLKDLPVTTTIQQVKDRISLQDGISPRVISLFEKGVEDQLLNDTLIYNYSANDDPGVITVSYFYLVHDLQTLLLTEKNILMELYSNRSPEALSHVPWGWGTENPVKDWEGVSTDQYGFVTSLDFKYAGLECPIQVSMGELVSLTHLNLSNNGLTGNIPESFGNLTSLTYLNLNSNYLTSIPESIGKLISLKDFNLYNNRLTGEIPASIGNLTSLQYLTLYSNQLTGEIPASIGNLTSLKVLSLKSNKLTGNIPASIKNLTSLILIDLHDNNLTGEIPENIRLLHDIYYKQ